MFDMARVTPAMPRIGIEAVASQWQAHGLQVNVAFADGRVFSGVQAKALHMVDQLGSLEDAVDRAATLAGLPLPPRVIQPRRRFSIFDLLRSAVGLPAPGSLVPSLPLFRTPLYLMD